MVSGEDRMVKRGGILARGELPLATTTRVIGDLGSFSTVTSTSLLSQIPQTWCSRQALSLRHNPAPGTLVRERSRQRKQFPGTNPQVPGNAQLRERTGISPKAALVKSLDSYRTGQGHLALKGKM